ncbi:MAG: DUF6576 domain-containing protein [Bacteroidota bacterium]
MELRQQIQQFLNRYQTTGWVLLLMAGGFVLQLVLMIGFKVAGQEAVYAIFMQKLVLPNHLKDLILQPWSILTYPFFMPGWDILRLLVNGLIIWAFGRIHQQLLGDLRTQRLLMLALPLIGLLTVTITSFTPVPQNVDPRQATEIVVTDSVAQATPPVAVESPAPPEESTVSATPERFNPYKYPAGVISLAMLLVISSISLVPSYPLELFLLGRVKVVWIGVALLFLEVMWALFISPLAIFILVGAALGFLHIYFLKKGTDITEIIWSYYSESGSKKHQKVEKPRRASDKPGSSTRKMTVKKGGSVPQEEVDRILDKINDKGYESLSREEKELLYKASNQKVKDD